MDAPTPVYWPFPVVPPEERTPTQRALVRFLEVAYDAGFRPCKYTELDFYMESPEGRCASVIYRGPHRNGNARWEVQLFEQPSRIASFWGDDLDAASATVFLWLRGGGVHEALAVSEGHFVRGPGIDRPLPANAE